MAKTYEELLASGSHGEIVAQIDANTKSVEALFAAAEARPDKAATQEELTQITVLDEQTDKLQVKALELKKLADIRTKTTKRREDMNLVTQPNGHPGPETKTDGVVQSTFVGAVKNFKGTSPHDAATQAFRFYRLIQAIKEQSIPSTGDLGIKWCRENGIELKTVQEGTPQDGGVLVPPEFERTLIDLREQYGSFRPNVKTVPMSNETKTIPRRTGGLTAYFVGENVTGTSSTPAWDNVTLIAKKLMIVAPYSTEISEDAMVNIGDTLAGEIAYAFARKEDDCGFLGDGTSTYGGMRGVIKSLLPGVSATIGSVAGIRVQGTISTGTFASAVLGDFNAVVGKLPKYADTPNAKWYMHKTFFHNVPGTLATAAGGVTEQGVAGGPSTSRFLGYPVEFAQVLPFTWAADTIFALFGDLSLAAKMGDRRQTTLFVDPYSLSTQGGVQIIGSERFDIIVHDVGDTTTPGPIVAFASAAS